MNGVSAAIEAKKLTGRRAGDFGDPIRKGNPVLDHLKTVFVAVLANIAWIENLAVHGDVDAWRE